jgi:hypothetical protein
MRERVNTGKLRAKQGNAVQEGTDGKLASGKDIKCQWILGVASLVWAILRYG